jgi:hypothetical protein
MVLVSNVDTLFERSHLRDSDRLDAFQFLNERPRTRRGDWQSPDQRQNLSSVDCAGRDGGASRDRTDDPLLAKQVLSQLSYGPEPLSDPGAAQLVEPALGRCPERSTSAMHCTACRCASPVLKPA